MKYSTTLHIEKGKAICYSGFREGQQPGGVPLPRQPQRVGQ